MSQITYQDDLYSGTVTKQEIQRLLRENDTRTIAQMRQDARETTILIMLLQTPASNEKETQ